MMLLHRNVPISGYTAKIAYKSTNIRASCQQGQTHFFTACSLYSRNAGSPHPQTVAGAMLRPHPTAVSRAWSAGCPYASFWGVILPFRSDTTNPIG